jgi:hypothetical protein
MREEFRAVGHVLLEQSELVFQFSASRVAQAFALLGKNVGLNLVFDGWLLRLLWEHRRLASVEATFEFSCFL